MQQAFNNGNQALGKENNSKANAEFELKCRYIRWAICGACIGLALALLISGAVLFNVGHEEIGLPLLITGGTLLVILCICSISIICLLIYLVVASAGGK